MQQLKREGWFHGYMRMLWGKKILEWSKTPDGALAVMEQLMNRYSLDGRDPGFVRRATPGFSAFTTVPGRNGRSSESSVQ